MQTLLQRAETAGRRAPTNNKGYGAPHTAALPFPNKHLDSATAQAVDKVFRRLSAEFAFVGYLLEKSRTHAGSYAVSRHGLVQEFRNLHAVVQFLYQIGAQP